MDNKQLFFLLELVSKCSVINTMNSDIISFLNKEAKCLSLEQQITLISRFKDVSSNFVSFMEAIQALSHDLSTT